MRTTNVSSQNLAEFAEEWILRRVNPISFSEGTQALWLLEQLADLCVAENTRVSQPSPSLGDRLNQAYGLLVKISESWGRESWRMSGKSERKPNVWKRENPKMVFAKKWDEIEIDQHQLHAAVADYLAKSYLRHPTLDWILLDMLVTRELVAWGLRVRYVGPIASWLLGQSHRRKRYLWAAMYDVWTFLTPPVVNPSVVRDLLIKTTNLGAGWDIPTWSVVDRAIAADPSVLLVEERGIYPTKTRRRA
jgi:hypothetical protein